MQGRAPAIFLRKKSHTTIKRFWTKHILQYGFILKLNLKAFKDLKVVELAEIIREMGSKTTDDMWLVLWMMSDCHGDNGGFGYVCISLTEAWVVCATCLLACGSKGVEREMVDNDIEGQKQNYLGWSFLCEFSFSSLPVCFLWFRVFQILIYLLSFYPHVKLKIYCLLYLTRARELSSQLAP
jgi:hypothetical protein